ncbi:alpha-N-acetyl-neuraminyl-2,3-beta-galactosyl-1,3-N-acetyl-galactosaminide alpha-2,6-sialyltransferase [Polypterus senegalus]|uniref:alpha-N-acetyl-neuraminyl-2,3-beta-galactosyl-1, 3-N-acetyl-galactosaminide alpha-2,6-sialyltransferase n=1 Tax=Polypterus senegalus TaxID=55291 RepID=UPI001963807F|nr:alpha-N-acetyl-neuraminyl-2,3-beta-galactosyl-1,3-N-acetyl-galactosaminide alpha-2,6-sialyltransferase [Polypterus senegalus]XP_039618499.1 alpha-N-acetyl-neuraminyl-2,3-beta-galactosyl-1,3-N-acetyl-galactosaminide alpha-2,6-sialyltransferase [Polypterus senegalus]XP_039618500.1 alpha-N-acetyl-neuraminyl-2,3-beta-galactosyl-1,3-N-acetyl-galactosaminide alpha-2,6-sialyltransferase [Polypterus senegalus]
MRAYKWPLFGFMSLFTVELVLYCYRWNNPAAVVDLKGYISISTGQYLQVFCKQCALVSNSGQMRGARRGGDIDEAGCVLRMNNAPTVGYESDVGSRTTLRVVSHTSVPLLVRNATYFFRQSADTLYVIWGPERKMKKDASIYNLLQKIQKIYPSVKLYVFTQEKMRSCDAIFQNETGKDRMKSGTFLSTGFFSLILAMDLCESISVYGMVDQGYCSQANRSSVPYHYYETAKLNECLMYNTHERAARGGHRFITEKAIFARWAVQRKRMTFTQPSWPELGSSLL